MTTVNVIDPPCGYGKTSWAIQYMNDMSDESHKFIYVTPFLDEVTRYSSLSIQGSFTNQNRLRVTLNWKTYIDC